MVYFVYIFPIFMSDHEGMLSKHAKAIPDVTFEIMSSPLSVTVQELTLKQGSFAGNLVGSAVFDPLSSSSPLGSLDLSQTQCDIHLLSEDNLTNK